MFSQHRQIVNSLFGTFIALAVLFPVSSGQADDDLQKEIRIISSPGEMVQYWQTASFWGEVDPSLQISVPRSLVVIINPGWKAEADKVTVAVKKELFYRALLPLVLYSNETIMAQRQHLLALILTQEDGDRLSEKDRQWLKSLSVQYRLIKSVNESIPPKLQNLLNRVDTIPPALALGQGAYESGYATSRFSLQGNALFGQWTYGGKGIKPKQQRKGKGDYRVASYDWPLESVEAYMLNLNTQTAYRDLRDKRAQLRKIGKPVTGMELVTSLSRYSERGEAYVKTLKGIMHGNELRVADNARLRDEPITLLVNVDPGEKHAVKAELLEMQNSGELAEIISAIGRRE